MHDSHWKLSWSRLKTFKHYEHKQYSTFFNILTISTRYFETDSVLRLLAIK